jgi:hypothetical protein
MFRTDKLEEVAFRARVSAIWIAVVNTRQRILEGRFLSPRGTDRAAVASFLDEVQFFFQDVQNIALIVCHGGVPPVAASARNMPFRSTGF